LKNIIDKIKENKKLAVYILIALIGIVFVLISGGVSATEADASLGSEEYRAMLEEKVAKLCSSVEGVGKCKVFITFKRGEQNTYKGSNLVESRPPEVLGVTVVCSGGDSERVKGELSDMLSALFDIGYNRIAILKLNS